MKKVRCLAAAAALLALTACAMQKVPAEQAIAGVESALAAVEGDAAKYAPEALAGVQTSIAGLKDSLAKGDYKAILAAAPNVTSQIGQLKDAALAKKAEVEAALAKASGEWAGYAADLPNMVAAIQSRVDVLSQSKKLPKNVDAASFESAKSGLEEMKTGWSEATNAATSGNFTDAVAKAQAVKDKGTAVMQLLGLSAS